MELTEMTENYRSEFFTNCPRYFVHLFFNEFWELSTKFAPKILLGFQLELHLNIYIYLKRIDNFVMTGWTVHETWYILPFNQAFFFVLK